MAEKRKPMSKKLRFEVFKRDSFTCQYCGSKAPDVILEVDHINPVNSGGKNDIMNLITSCFDCNRGKGKRELSDNQILKQQQEQLKEINTKREQLKLMLKWKQELSNFEDEQVDQLEDMYGEHGKSFTNFGRQEFKKWIKKYGFIEVMECFEISINQYINGSDAGYIKAIDYVPRICHRRKIQTQNPILKEIPYIKSIIRNRFGIYNEKRVDIMLNTLVNDEVTAEETKHIAKTSRNWSDFWDNINELFEGGW